VADRIARFDRDHARQLRRSSLSVISNIAEGGGCRGGSRLARYRDALGSAEEARAQLRAAAAIGYCPPMSDELSNRFNHIIGVLVKVTR
jgi:four helix bundle protein